MEWIFIALIGAFIGLLVAYGAAQALRMPSALVITIGVIGALGGAFLQQATGSLIFGPWTFYLGGIGLAIALEAGGLLGYSLTNEERRT